MTQEELRRWNERQEQERQRKEAERLQKQAEQQAQQAEQQAQQQAQQAEQQAAQATQAAQNTQPAQPPVYASADEKAQAQGMRRTIAEYSKGVDYKVLDKDEYHAKPGQSPAVADAINKAYKDGDVKVGQTTFGVAQEIKPNYKSIKDTKQAAFFAMALDENDREKYVKQYAKSIGREYDEVLGEMEGFVGDSMFAEPKSTAAKNRMIQADNAALMYDFNSFGITNYDGTPVNFNTASLNEIVNLIKTNPDKQTREDMTDLLVKATKQKGNRFYGRTIDTSDTKSFLETADFNVKKYDDFVSRYLTGKFYRASGHDEDNEKAYGKAMDWIDTQNLSEYEKKYFRKAVELEFQRQTGNGFSGTYTPTEQEAAESEDERSMFDEWRNYLSELWNSITGKGGSDASAPAVAPSAAPSEAPEATATPAPTPSPRATQQPEEAPELEVPEAVQEKNSEEPKVEAKVAQNVEPKTEKPKEVAGPPKPETIKKAFPEGLDMDVVSAYYDILDALPEGVEETEEQGEERKKRKSNAMDAVAMFYDTVMKDIDMPTPSEKHGAPELQDYVGTVDLANQPERALLYRMQGRESLLTEETLNSLDSYVNGSAGRMAAVGILTPENLNKFAKIDENGEITELGNQLATDIYGYNYGYLGELSKYALKLQDPEFPPELLDDAVGTLFQTIDDAEKHARDDRDGSYDPNLVNIYSQELELYPEKREALDAAFGYEAELNEKKKENARISAESEAKAKQERLDQAIAAFKTGDATQEDIDLVFQHAPDLNDTKLLSDPMYAQFKQDIALDRTFSDVEEGGWFNDQATAYLMRSGVNAEPGSVAMGQAKDYVAGFLEDAVAKLTECAYALDYGNLENYMNSTGLKWETIQEIALHDMRVFENGLTPEVVEKAEEVVAGTYTGEGLKGYSGLAKGIAQSIDKGTNDFLASKLEASIAFAAATNIDVDAARAKALYTTKYGFSRAEREATKQLLELADNGYFPIPEMNETIKEYLNAGGNPFDLGIIPSDFSARVEKYNEKAKNSETIQKWAYKNLTPGQGKAFEVGVSTTMNFENQALALALNYASPATSLINSMIAYGDSAYVEGFAQGLDNGHGFKGAGLIGMSKSLGVALANMGTDAKILEKLKPASNAIDLAVGNAPLPRTLNWMKAGVLSAFETLTDEVVKDEFTEAIYGEALAAGAESLIQSTDNLTKLPGVSGIAKAAKSAIFSVDVAGTASEVLKNAPENFVHMLPMALLTGGSTGWKAWKSYDAVKKATKTGDPNDYIKAQQAFAEDMKDPVKAKEFDKAIDTLDKAVRTAEIIQDGEGEVGQIVEEAAKVQEQADAHKEKLDASQAALDEAVAQHEEAIEAVISGPVDDEVVQAANDSAEAISKNQTSVSEHQHEFEQKQAEADKLSEQAVSLATTEASQIIAAEKMAQAEENQTYSIDNPAMYSGSEPVSATNTDTGESDYVIGIVGKTSDGEPIFKLDNGTLVSNDDFTYDIETEDYSEMSELFDSVEDKLPVLEQNENGEWVDKLSTIPSPSKFKNIMDSPVQTMTMDDDGSWDMETTSDDVESQLTPEDIDEALNELEIDLDNDQTHPFKHLDHEYSATMLVDGELEPVSVLDMVGYTSITGNPVFELSNGKYVTIDALSNVEGNLYDDALDAMFDAPDGSMLKFQPGQYITFADLNAGEDTVVEDAVQENEEETAAAPTKLLDQEYEAELHGSIGSTDKVKVVDLVGVSEHGAPIVELSDGTKTTVYALKNPELKKVVAQKAAATSNLPVYNVGEYKTVSDFKSEYGTKGKKSTKAAVKIQLEDWQNKKYHGAVKEPKKASTESEQFKAWFNDPTGDLTNDDGTPKVFYRGFGGFGNKVYVQHESKPHSGKFINFYSASFDMSKTYANGDPNIVKHYDIKNWETAKAAMQNMGGDLITDSVAKGYRVKHKDGTYGKFYKENELSKFNKEYGKLEATGIHAGYISVQNPLVLDAKGAEYSAVYGVVQDKDGNLYTATKKTRDWAKWAWDNGYDSVIVRNVIDDVFPTSKSKPGLEVITSESSMYKSIYNTGKFDKSNPDIRYYKPGTFALTGKPISDKMNDILNRLSVGEKVYAEDIYGTPEVAYAIENAKKGSSLEDFKNDPERAEIQRAIVDDLTSLGSAESIAGVDGKPQIVYTGEVKQERRMDIVIGPPAAGKSSVLVDPLSHIFKSRVVDSDMAKERLPEYEGGLNSGYVHDESSAINKILLQESMDRGDNIVLPVVGWHLDSMREKIKAYKAAGYEVHLHLNSLPAEKAMGRMLGRMLKDGRFITPEYLLEDVKERPNAVYEQLKYEGVADGYTKWSNDVAYGKDPILVSGEGEGASKAILEGRRSLQSVPTGDRADQGIAPKAGSAQGMEGSAGTDETGQEGKGGDLKYLKGTQSNQGASSNSEGNAPNDKAKSPMKIAQKLADDLGVKIYKMKNLHSTETLKPLPNKVKAYYSDMLNVVGVRAKDSGKLVEMFHELTHALGNKTGMEGTQRMIDALPERFKENYKDSELPGEALAEFGWKYFFNPQEAENIAGTKFVSEFEAALKREGLYKAVKEAQEDMQLYRNLGTTGKTLAHMVDYPTSSKKTTFTSILASGVDETAALRPILNRLAEKFGYKNIKNNMNPVIQARTAQTAALRAERVFDNGVTDANWKLVAEGFEQRVIKPYLKTKEDYDNYYALLLDEHALDRSKQGKVVFDGYVMTDGELRANVERIRREMPHVASAVDATHGFWDDVMYNYMVAPGFMRQEAYDYLKKVYPHYIPTVRDKGDSGAGASKSKTYTVKRAIGSTEDIINPIIAMRGMVESMVRQVSQNNVALAVDRAYNAIPEVMSEYLVPISESKRNDVSLTKEEMQDIQKNLKPGEDLMEAILNKMAEKDLFKKPARSGEPGTMVVQHADGSITEYKVSDPDMLEAIMGSGEKGVDGLARAIKRVTSAMSLMTTGNSPKYGILKNPPRDFFTSLNYGSWAYTPVDAAIKFVAAGYDVLTKSDGYRQHLATGAGGMQAYAANLQTSNRKFLKKLMPKREAKTKKEKLFNALDSAMEVVGLTAIGNFFENTNRYVESKYGKLNVKNADAESGDFARINVNQRDVTVDFFGTGTSDVMKDLAAITPFFRAGINGSYRQARMYLDPMERDRLPARLTKTILNTSLVSAASAIAMLACLDDDEKEAYVEYLTQDLKSKNWYIPNPMYRLGMSDEPFARIPLPQDALSYATHAAITNFLWFGEENEIAINMCAAVDAMVFNSLVPTTGTIFKPFVDAYSNKTHYGGSIIPRSMLDYNPLTPMNQYTETTPTFFRGVSAALNGIGIQVSPMKLQYVCEQLGGYPAEMFVAAFSPDEFTGELGGLKAIANVYEKSITSDPYVSQSMTSAFYDAKKLLDEIVNDAEAGKAVASLKSGLSQREVDDAVSDAKSLNKGIIKDGSEAITAMYATVDEINANQSLSSKAKNRLIREARKECLDTLSNINATLWAYQEKYCTSESLIGHFIKNNKTYSLAEK